MPTPSRRVLVDRSLLAAKAPVKIVRAVVHETAGLLERDGRLNTGDGIIATVIALVLGFLSRLVHHVFGWLIRSDFQQAVQHIPFVPQLLSCILVADLAQYWTHRAYHEVPYLWRYHSVHRSTKTMDWLAGSRQHMLELIVTRVLVLAPIFVLGFSEAVVNAYIIVVGFQAVFNHANVHLPWGPLKYLIVTPDFHHWHHSADDEAIDRNYAAHYSFLDYLFGSAVKVPANKPFPAKYGVVGDYMPDGFVKQQMFPFRAKPVAQSRD